jgi:hypothetical protein
MVGPELRNGPFTAAAETTSRRETAVTNHDRLGEPLPDIRRSETARQNATLGRWTSRRSRLKALLTPFWFF